MDFFIDYKESEKDVKNDLYDFIVYNSNIYLESLYVKCIKDNGRFYGYIAARCTPKKIDFEFLIKK